jgi:hypothetical protein
MPNNPAVFASPIARDPIPVKYIKTREGNELGIFGHTQAGASSKVTKLAPPLLQLRHRHALSTMQRNFKSAPNRGDGRCGCWLGDALSTSQHSELSEASEAELRKCYRARTSENCRDIIQNGVWLHCWVSNRSLPPTSIGCLHNNVQNEHKSVTSFSPARLCWQIVC